MSTIDRPTRQEWDKIRDDHEEAQCKGTMARAKPLVEQLPRLCVREGRARLRQPVPHDRHQEGVHRVSVEEDIDRRSDGDLPVGVFDATLAEQVGHVEADRVHHEEERRDRDGAHLPLGWWPEGRLAVGRVERVGERVRQHAIHCRRVQIRRIEERLQLDEQVLARLGIEPRLQRVERSIPKDDGMHTLGVPRLQAVFSRRRRHRAHRNEAG
mmetsp:Transcript_8898/g.22786  ORF Transcript_8898/g.22786 Transcript_8898/m.22786 type:complete len:212 (+) Transcript_8898:345-980(+)